MTVACVLAFNRREHVRACRLIDKHAIRNRWLRRLTKVMMWLGGIFLALMAAGQWSQGEFLSLWVFLAWLAFLAVIPLLPTLAGYGSARQWEKLNAGSRTVTFDIDGERVSSSSGIGRMEIRWAGVRQVVETSEFILFYMSDKMAMYLPKRVVSPPDRVSIGHLARAHVAAERLHLLPEPSAET